MDEWQERPYGWKKEIGHRHKSLRIRPDHHTRLKEHDVKWEKIIFSGYVDGADTVKTLLYTTSGGKMMSYEFYEKGDEFYSVSADGAGRFHDLSNIGSATIELDVSWEE